MEYETTVKHKVHGVNITNTTNLVPVRNPVPVPLLAGVEILRGANFHTNTAYRYSIHVFFRACFIQANPWVNPMMMSG